MNYPSYFFTPVNELYDVSWQYDTNDIAYS